MIDLTEITRCPLTGDTPAPPPPACPSCNGTGRVVVAEPAYTQVGACECVGGRWWRGGKEGEVRR